MEVLLLISAFLWDILLGEPKLSFHPVAITGKLVEKVDVRVDKRGKIFELAFGGFLVILGILIFLGAFLAIKKVAELLFKDFYSLKVVAEFLISVFFLKSTFAIRSMNEHAKAVFSNLKRDNIPGAKSETSKIVSRNTENLDKPHLISATVESIAENFVDSVLSPFFFFVVAGIEGAILYRVVNTLDAIIGYKNERYIWRGFFAAKLDDFMNLIPARLSIFFITISAVLLGMGGKEALRTLRDFRGVTPSPNSYIPICLFAGALKIKLEKIGFYSIGNFDLPSDEEKIKDALKLLNLSAFILLLVSVITLFIKDLI